MSGISAAWSFWCLAWGYLVILFSSGFMLFKINQVFFIIPSSWCWTFWSGKKQNLQRTVMKYIRRWATYPSQWEWRQWNHKGTPSPEKKKTWTQNNSSFPGNLITWPASLVGKTACMEKLQWEFWKPALVKEQQRPGWEPEQTPARTVHTPECAFASHCRSRWRSWYQISFFSLSFIYLILQHTGVHFLQWGPIMSTWLTKMLL